MAVHIHALVCMHVCLSHVCIIMIEFVCVFFLILWMIYMHVWTARPIDEAVPESASLSLSLWDIRNQNLDANRFHTGQCRTHYLPPALTCTSIPHQGHMNTRALSLWITRIVPDLCWSKRVYTRVCVCEFEFDLTFLFISIYFGLGLKL